MTKKNKKKQLALAVIGVLALMITTSEIRVTKNPTTPNQKLPEIQSKTIR